MDANQLPTTEEIGRRFRELRVEQGLDTAAVARRSGRAVELIDSLETGRDDANLDDLLAIADALGISMTTVCRLAEAGRRLA